LKYEKIRIKSLKTIFMKFFYFLLAITFPFSLLAQNDNKGREAEQIIITQKGKGAERYNITIDGDNVIVNGQHIDNDKDANITVKRRKIKDMEVFSDDFPNADGNKHIFMRQYAMPQNPNKAMLGVSTEKADDGVRIMGITEGSAAEKAGLKEGDIISEVNQLKIETPDDLSKSIRDKNPGDIVKIVYFRNGKQSKAVAELTKWVAPDVTWNNNFNTNVPVPEIEELMRELPNQKLGTQRQFFHFNIPDENEKNSKLGMKVQDMENGTGVKVIEVLPGSDADKAGVRNGDIIKEVNGDKVDGTDTIRSLLRIRKLYTTTKLKIERNGKIHEINILNEKKIKTTDL
jgi:serine protease Do